MISLHLCLLWWYASRSRRSYLDSSLFFLGNALRLHTMLQHTPQFIKFKQHIHPQQKILKPQQNPRSVKYSSFSIGTHGATMEETSCTIGAIVRCGGFTGLSDILSIKLLQQKFLSGWHWEIVLIFRATNWLKVLHIPSQVLLSMDFVVNGNQATEEKSVSSTVARNRYPQFQFDH